MSNTIEAKIDSVKHNGVSPVVTVGFYNGETQLGERVFYLTSDQTIEDLKPEIKDALNDFQATVEKTDSLKSLEGTVVDVSKTKSAREIKEEENALRDAEKKATVEALKK